MEVRNTKSFVHTRITGQSMDLSVDIVPPPASWNAEPSMVDELTHLNIKAERVSLHHGLGIMGTFSVGNRMQEGAFVALHWVSRL